MRQTRYKGKVVFTMHFLLLFAVLFLLPVVVVIVLFALFYSRLWKMKSGIVEQKNDDLKTVVPEENKEWGLVEIENIYRNKQMDIFLKGLYRERLLKWDANENVSLNWKGKHLIKLYLINGGYEEVVVEVEPSEADKIFVNQSVVSPFQKTEPPKLEPEKEKEIWLEENLSSIIKELKDNRMMVIEKKNYSITEEVWILVQKELVDSGDFSAVELCSDCLKITRG